MVMRLPHFQYLASIYPFPPATGSGVLYFTGSTSYIPLVYTVTTSNMFGTKRNTAFKWTKTAVDSLDLAGKKIAVIGGTDGLGRAVARLAAQKGAEVTVIGRTDRDPGVQNITFAPADLSLMRNAKKLGESAALSPQLDVLLFTNGIIAATKREVCYLCMAACQWWWGCLWP